jgi:glycosyltransferase involved in cell wall biosynthesis
LNIGIDASVLCDKLTGIGWYLWRNLQAMHKLETGHAFHLYASRPLVVDITQERIQRHLTRPPVPIPGTFWRQLRIPSLARQNRLTSFWGPNHLLPINLSKTIRAVLTVHDLVSVLYPASMGNYNAFIHKLYFRKSVARADAIIAVSARTKRDLVAILGAPESRITVIPEGVEPVFRPLSPDLVHSRLSQLGINGDYILSVGTLEPRKNYPLLFRALARLRKWPHLVVVGGLGWKYRDILTEQARAGLSDGVRLMGYVSTEDLVVLYNGAKLFVFPSLYEGFGLPLLEAMACGTPVLASSSSSLPEVGGDAAAYFDSHSVESLVAELDRLLDDPSQLALMREKGLVRARQFSWERSAERTLRVCAGAGHEGSANGQ